MNTRLSTIGIMFDALAGDASDTFPRLADIGHAWHGHLDHGEVDYDEWFAVATNPYEVTYYDDDTQAMDETNFVAVFGEPGEIWRACDYDKCEWLNEENVTIVRYGRIILIDPDDADTLASCLASRDRLADYPLLDESGYSEREYNAWLDFMDNGLRYDTVRELAGADEDTIDLIDENWTTVAPVACERLDYYYGFTGEHSPDFSECVAATIVDALARVFMG